MARPREFETDVALDRGMHLLWAHGYEATSLDDLLHVMGLSKSSFYETFGTKHDFLMAALTRYIDVVLGQLGRDLAEGPARRAIVRVFEAALPSGRGPRGCFVQNCAIEMAHRDPAAADKVRQGLKRLEEGFYRAVVRGQDTGEFSRDRDARVMARYLVGSLNGVQVLVRAGLDGKHLHQIIDVTLASLG